MRTFQAWRISILWTMGGGCRLRPVWYPADMPVGWVPYRYGHWLWVDPWGWTWVADEAWRFCPFHFGRWALIGSIWGWVPGPVAVISVYAPALVAFVDAAAFSISVQAWFPLGPGEPFFPWYHHGLNYLREINITNVRNVTNITNIIDVTKISNIHYAYKTVATTAVPVNVFRSGQPVAHQLVRVAPQQLAKASVIPHPSVAPAPAAAFGGRGPIKPPPVRATRLAAAPFTRPPQVKPPASEPIAQRPTVAGQVSARSPATAGPLPGAAPHLVGQTRPPPSWPNPRRRQAMCRFSSASRTSRFIRDARSSRNSSITCAWDCPLVP